MNVNTIAVSTNGTANRKMVVPNISLTGNAVPADPEVFLITGPEK